MIVVSRELLEQLAGEARSQQKRKSNGPAMSEPEGAQALRQLLAFHDVEIADAGPYKDDHRFVLECCPFDSGHPEAAVFLRANGSIGFNCFHGSCKGKKWRDVLRLWGVEGQTNKRSKKASSAQAEPAVEEPEPETDAEGDDHEIAEDILKVCRRYIAAEDAILHTVPIYTLHTHCFLKTACFTPYAHATSAEKLSGKTTLLDFLRAVVRKPGQTDNISPAALARSIEKDRPTLLLDEIDLLLNPKTNPETAGLLRGILNGGFHVSGSYTRMVGSGADMEPKAFHTFCPKVLAGIGDLPDTLASRSLPWRLKRVTQGQVELFRPDGMSRSAKTLRAELAELHRRAERWGRRHAEKIANCEPACPASLNSRQRDISEPLIAVAEILGGEWPARISSALTTLFASPAAADTSTTVLLLGHIRKIFLDKYDDGDHDNVESEKRQIRTKELLEKLRGNPEWPWAEWNKGKGLDDCRLAALLRNHGPGPRTIRDPDPCRGYRLTDFLDAFQRYLRPVCICQGCGCHEACSGSCSTLENEDSTNVHAGCSDFGAKKQGVRGEGRVVN